MVGSLSTIPGEPVRSGIELTGNNRGAPVISSTKTRVTEQRDNLRRGVLGEAIATMMSVAGYNPYIRRPGQGWNQ